VVDSIIGNERQPIWGRLPIRERLLGGRRLGGGRGYNKRRVELECAGLDDNEFFTERVMPFDERLLGSRDLGICICDNERWFDLVNSIVRNDRQPKWSLVPIDDCVLCGRGTYPCHYEWRIVLDEPGRLITCR
jgi:hypothetical protein